MSIQTETLFGSSLAMYHVLTGMGKDVDIVIPEFPEKFNFLPGSENVKKQGREDAYDLGIALDCSDLKRLKGYENWYESAKVKISIDHHGSNTMFADYNYIDPVSPACAQILLVILYSLNVDITKDIGTCILTGIATDTGGFRYEGVTTETFEIVSRLLRLGVNISYVCKKALQLNTKTHFELSKLIMARMEFFEERKDFIYIYNS